MYIYPNPNFGQLHINGYDQSMVALEIYSTTGALIYKQALDSETKDISNLSSGYYLYKIKDAAGATIKQDKFIIEKK